jgi:hypothetical protein
MSVSVWIGVQACIACRGLQGGKQVLLAHNPGCFDCVRDGLRCASHVCHGAVYYFSIGRSLRVCAVRCADGRNG